MAPQTPSQPYLTSTRPYQPFVPPATSHLNGAAYLVGTPISHSRSPALHHAIYSSLELNLAQLLVETDDLLAFISYLRHDPKAIGSGVTMPFKVAVIPLLDELTEAGHAVGAVNTIFLRTDSSGRRKLIGTNTDVLGIRDAIVRNVPREICRGRPALIVGGGGTCRAAIYALHNLLGCSPIYIVNRDRKEVDAVMVEYIARGGTGDLVPLHTVEEAEMVEVPGVIVSAVPDYEPVTQGEILARRMLIAILMRRRRGCSLLEMCYHPSPDTSISRLALKYDWNVIGGIEAMIGQGIAQAEMWAEVKINSSLRRKVSEVVMSRSGHSSKL